MTGDATRVEGARPPSTTPTVSAAQNKSGHSVGTDVPAGSETERDAPGAPSKQKADNTK